MQASELKSKRLIGLSDVEVKKSYEAYGNNKLLEKKQKGFIARYFENFNDPIIRILLFSLVLHAIFSLGRINWFETIGIVLAIILSTTVSTISEYGSANAFSKMQKMVKNNTCRVIRNGEISMISSDELVRGDLLILSAGTTVPADGRIIDGSVGVDQSALNGEGEEVEKTVGQGEYSTNLSQSNLLFRGSVLLSGECKLEVARTGMDTLYGQIALELQDDTRESPLKLRLAKLAKQISVIGYIAAVLVAVTYLFNEIFVANRFSIESIVNFIKNPVKIFPTLLHAFTLAITIVVVAVPEGLPMMIAVVLSSNMRKMAKDNVLVRKMVGIETAGSMNMLFCDKTGTLTMGKMKVQKFILGDGSVLTSKGEVEQTSSIFRTLHICAYYNTDSSIAGGEIYGGNATDRAILSYFSTYPTAEAEALNHTHFDSRLRYESSQIKENALTYTVLKGAPELFFPKISKFLGKDGTIQILSDKTLSLLRQKWLENASKGNRIIAVCVSDKWENDIKFYDNLTLIAFICIKDVLRKDAKTSVSVLHKAGIQVIMMTGDNLNTATAIAEECGIYRSNSNHLAIKAEDIARFSDQEILDILPNLRVVARALPSDKSRLVRIAQSAELVVGMTGDGINDASALKMADVGFAMGQGTDIAKEASDIVLIDGSIKSIVNTVLYGRTIFHSIRKFISFQLIMNLCAVGVSLFGQCFGIENPITIIQMLWVNMIMDTLGGLAFAGEPPLLSYLDQKPKNRNENLINFSMLSQIVGDGCFVLLLCGLFLGLPYFRGLFEYSTRPLVYLTSFFVLFIFLGLFVCFCLRTEKVNLLSNLAQNPSFILIMGLISIVQITMVNIGGSIFRTTPLNFEHWIWIIFLAFSIVPMDFLRKCIFKLANHPT